MILLSTVGYYFQFCRSSLWHSFFSDLLGMTLLRTSHHSDFSLYFLAHISPDEAAEVGSEDFIGRRFGPVIELTHNHGTENDAAFR
jgi:lactoylglutathione lyase